MKIPTFLRGVLGFLPRALIKVVPTDTQKIVAVLLTLPIASDASDNILALANDSLSGRQKADIVIGKALPALVGLIADKGMVVPDGDVEDIARELVQTLYNQVASPRAALLARALLPLFGVK
ncbi:hypothetical protein [Sphingomonas sp. 2SG]|uniref:hypothetical protein n=1 Tax=Sphingomonas sp. 2SG TaxID=2502201 RepID=UPI0010F92941|nr:hypothetical protein [Sphingomonas sp. 2SG]